MKKKKGCLILLSALITGILLTGCKDKKVSSPPKRDMEIFPGVLEKIDREPRKGRRGGTMIRADIQDYDTFNIVTTRSWSLYNILTLVFEGLLSLNPITGEIQGEIAKGYEVVNDGYALLLRLNEDVYFSDGKPCTAEDVRFTLEEIYMNPDVNSRKTEVLKVRDKLISLTVIDEKTIRFDLPLPYRPFLHTLTRIEVLPKHILAPLIEKEGIEAFNREWGNLKGEVGNVIGTGPYFIKEHKSGNLIRLARNPYYRKREGSLFAEGIPYLDEIIELLDIDDETKLLKFQIGEIDFYDIKDFDISSGDFATLLNNQQEGRYRIYTGGQTLGSNHFLLFNQNPVAIDPETLQIFQNPIFRQAVSKLIDRAQIVNEVYRGYAYLDSSPERNLSPFYKFQQPLPYDPVSAAGLLSQINLKDTDGDGFLELPSGKPFGFTILTNEDNPFRVRMGELIAERLKNAGIQVEFHTADYNAIVTKLLDTFDWDAVIIGVEGSIDPNDASWIWESKGPLHIWAPYMESPQTDWERRIDVLFALGRTTWNFEKAKSFYDEYQDIVAEQLPVINILIPAQLYGFRNDFGNVLPSAVTYNAIGLIPFLYRKR